MKFIIAGGRDFNNSKVMDNILNKYINPSFDSIIAGGARGADSLAADWANKHGIPTQIFNAKWDEYGKAAGYIRNAEMAEEGDALIAFWDGQSKGTMNMIKAMKLHKKLYYVYNYSGELQMKGG